MLVSVIQPVFKRTKTLTVSAERDNRCYNPIIIITDIIGLSSTPMT